MEQYEQLFKAVSQIVQQAKVAKEESRLRGEQFNIFKLCGIDHYELQHSAIIAELLNPQGSHGQGCLYLKLFMETYGSKLKITQLNPIDISVTKEERSYNDKGEYNGRMDIFVDYHKIPLVIIENKIFANDQPIQLKKYDSEAKNRNAKEGEYEIVYLTLDGKDASDDSGKDVKYIRMSYAKDVIKWLDFCIEKSSKIPLVRETLIQYQNHIKQLTHQDMDENSRNELFEIMVKNHEEVDAIINASNDGYFDYLFDKFVKPDLLEFSKKNGLKYIPPLFFTKDEWQGAKLGIYISKTKATYGISYGEQVEVQRKIWDYPNEWWPYGYFDGHLFNDWKEPSLFPKMIKKEFSKEVIEIVTRMLDDVKNAKVELTIPIKHK